MTASCLYAPVAESLRQASVERSGAVHRRGHREIQRITGEAAESYRTPIAAVTIISGQRQILIARCGIDDDETPREAAFCAVAIHSPGEALVVADAFADSRFRHHPAVVAEPHVRFYAGMPIVSRDGYALGALCVADLRPRPGGVDVTALMLLARQVERQLWR